MRPQVSRTRAFTLIELLVVVAIIALLIAVILPQLNRAREQGRIAVCLSNQKNISLAATMYRQEDKSKDLPWAVPFQYRTDGFSFGTAGYATEFIWGGGTPDRTFEQWRDATGTANPNYYYHADILRIPPRARPMNKYVTPNVSWDGADRDPPSHAGTPRERIPMPLPGIFICPSDKSATVPDLCANNQANVETDSAYNTWQNWGTSYPINWYWARYFRKAPQGVGNGECNKSINALGLYRYVAAPYASGQGAWMLGKGAVAGWESRFIIFYENLFNYAAQGALPQGLTNAEAKVYRGWHGQPNYHAAAYLDGHADYRRRDTRYVEGPGWTTWPARPYEGWNAP
ncbi:MAG: type II secretion system GspH family protein [Phycisphaerae bacterium]|jgi:prepilin-type N-terminal cleavage/methylation domain-containing protein|nr:type II secretion system protein [Phycisphaerae bacterium]MCZ2401264.1 type II secretion system GspH family protein [Phycisphaerae bacterium]NUQ49053.1 type II secretion system protein [Phycisphaerae bacterium]